MRRRAPTAAFTLVEVAVAGALLVVLISAMAVSMTQINRWATAARLHTLALVLAQQKADEVLTTPWSLRNARPAVLTAGTVTEAGMSLNSDALNAQSGLSSAFTSLSGAVGATRVTEVTDLPPRMVRAVVRVSFIYSGRTYQTSLTTLRSTDDI